MSTTTSINTALCLPASDVAALGKGQMIAALSRTFVTSMQQFALCPVEAQNSSSTISINLWAKPEFCKIYSESEDIEKLARLTTWSNEYLQKVLQERYKLFLLCLRVFQIPQNIELPLGSINLSKVGSFIKLPNSLSPSHAVPVLPDDFFNQRKQQLINLELPPHAELHELQNCISELVLIDEKARDLDDLIQSFLGWKNKTLAESSKQEFDWIDEITALGSRSIEEETGKKSNYQAGTDFENIIRKSLQFLGFKVEEDYKGGAGGLDLFCSTPYYIVAECKSGKSIPDRAVEELDRIGKRHLDKDYMKAVRLIIGPGQPTKQLKKSAITSEVSIISDMSLQKLVELQAKYSGSVDLIELKKYLEPGQIDQRIDEYVKKVLGEINLRFHIVQVVKKYLDQVKAVDASIDTLFGVYCGSNPPQIVSQKDFQEILIELSSPLVGYLGRVRSHNLQSDRFYFLRDMPEVSQ